MIVILDTEQLPGLVPTPPLFFCLFVCFYLSLFNIVHNWICIEYKPKYKEKKNVGNGASFELHFLGCPWENPHWVLYLKIGFSHALNNHENLPRKTPLFWSASKEMIASSLINAFIMC